MQSSTITVDPVTQARRDAATAAFKIKMHNAWHAARKLPVCDPRECVHARPA